MVPLSDPDMAEAIDILDAVTTQSTPRRRLI